MSRVHGSGRPGSPNPGDKKERPQKPETNPAQALESSEQSQSTESLDERGRSRPAMKSKMPAEEMQAGVAPHSTRHNNEERKAPAIRASSKREAFKRKAKRERDIGIQGRHRRRESDFKGNYPELKSLRKARRRNDVDSRPPSLDPGQLVEQAKSAGGHLHVRVKDQKDTRLLADVLKANPSIRSLKLACDFGGTSGLPGDPDRDELYSSLVFHGEKREGPALPDTDSLRCILSACKDIDALDLKGCRLTEQDWLALAERLRGLSNLRHLEFGGGDHISGLALAEITSSISSRAASLRELVIDGISMHSNSFARLLAGMKEHGKLSLIKLQNISNALEVLHLSSVDSVLSLCASNPGLQYLSMAGTRFRDGLAANDDFRNEYIDLPERSASSAGFKTHACLRVVDLSGCGLDEGDMETMATACEGHASLIDIRIEGNVISESDCTRLKASAMRNRELLEVQASTAFDLLVTHAANRPDVWPRELSEVLVKNTPADVLPNISAMIDSAWSPSADGRIPATTATRGPEHSASSSTHAKASKNKASKTQ